jgi:hypothetical protein
MFMAAAASAGVGQMAFWSLTQRRRGVGRGAEVVGAFEQTNATVRTLVLAVYAAACQKLLA